MSLLRWLISGLCATAIAAASPSISKISPRAVIPGKKTSLTLYGSQLENVSNLWTSFGPTAYRIAATNDTFTFQVICPENATGIGAIQAYGPEGVSDFHLILIDPFPTTHRADGSLSSPATAPLTSPAALDEAFRSEQVDQYAFSAKAGEELSIEVLAHRIGSQADPVLRVLDRHGRELAFCDDDDSVWRDARLRFRAPSAANYTLAVHDVGYAGGASSFYRLRLGDFPVLWSQFPLRDWTETGTREETTIASSVGQSPANPDSAVWFSSNPMLIEHEPNDAAATAQEFSLPAILNGRFQSRTDRDFYRFTAAKDQKITFHRQSRSLGSPCDVVLRILKQSGELVAETDGRTLDEIPLTRTFDSPGAYLLEVRELTGVAPTNSPYRVKIENAVPGFRLSTDINKLEITSGGSAKLKITCQRFDYDGEINLKSTQVQLENNIIPVKKNEAEVTVKLTDDIPFLHFTITGHSTNHFQTLVSTRPALRKTFPLMLIPPPDLDGRVALGVKR